MGQLGPEKSFKWLFDVRFWCPPRNLSNGHLMLDFDHNGILYLHLVATRALRNDWTGSFLLTTLKTKDETNTTF